MTAGVDGEAEGLHPVVLSFPCVLQTAQDGRHRVADEDLFDDFNAFGDGFAGTAEKDSAQEVGCLADVLADQGAGWLFQGADPFADSIRREPLDDFLEQRGACGAVEAWRPNHC